MQSLISNSVGDDEQGTMQGAITSLESISGIIGPLIATQLFSHFIDAERTVQVPGAPFFQRGHHRAAGIAGGGEGAARA